VIKIVGSYSLPFNSLAQYPVSISKNYRPWCVCVANLEPVMHREGMITTNSLYIVSVHLRLHLPVGLLTQGEVYCLRAENPHHYIVTVSLVALPSTLPYVRGLSGHALSKPLPCDRRPSTQPLLFSLLVCVCGYLSASSTSPTRALWVLRLSGRMLDMYATVHDWLRGGVYGQSASSSCG
jgi:hypothetical protein